MTEFDVTAREKAELTLERIGRALRTLNACNEALLRVETESDLLNSICRIIVEKGGYAMAWYGAPVPARAVTVQGTMVQPLAQYGREDGFLAEAKSSWVDLQQVPDPTSTAVRAEADQVFSNLSVDFPMDEWQEAALKRGYRSCVALPIKGQNGTLGVLTIFASIPDAFDETEVVLLRDLAKDMAYGIETRRMLANLDHLSSENQQYREVLQKSLEGSVKAIADSVEKRQTVKTDYEKGPGLGHLTSALAGDIAREMGLPQETIHNIELAAWVHDLGNITLPAEMFTKPSRLTEEEMALVKNHARVGYELLKNINLPESVATMVWQHHERQDGSGYPQGLKGDEILLESRIMAVADVVESMVTRRPYRQAPGIELALQEIERGKGTLFDAAVVDACLRLFK